MSNSRRTSSISQTNKVGLSFLEEFELKKLEAKKRLSKVFVAFIRSSNNGYLVCGGNEPPTHFGNSNFGCVIVGASLFEINQGEDLIRRVGSRISSLFSEKDFQSTVVVNFLSEYLHKHVQNIKIPQALAVEFIITNFKGTLFRVHFSGDIEIDVFNDTDDKIFLSGCYDKEFKKNLLADLKKAPALEADKKVMKEFVLRLKKKYNLSCAGIIL